MWRVPSAGALAAQQACQPHETNLGVVGLLLDSGRAGGGTWGRRTLKGMLTFCEHQRTTGLS
jgi:hypothetical protein